ncbi:hypothetical protein HYH03_017215 [Edaphochlamys debaryana]|uniref:Uncharacterized protein n=1 Tax=Edaphochlamys debaryana TaxID=47281 RepID=A0A836BPD4_9CHLO|nr:hypothetical protein HYH03_017215 [Edaphochlamys debaryana]|eukprot:KAG2483970.1 hypothetical protein HYH03_017215 [Edaphochlamys debaryana]
MHKEDVAPLQGADERKPYEPLLSSTSLPVHVPSPSTGAPLSTLRMGLHHGFVLDSAPSKETASQEDAPPFVVDAVSFAGGAVWCGDFCPPPRGVPTSAMRSLPPRSPPPIPAPAPGDEGDEFMLIGAHPPGQATHSTNVPLSGPGVLQLWAMPHGATSALCPQGVPTCSLLIAHEGAVAWDIRWCAAPGCIWTEGEAESGPGSGGSESASGSGSESLPVLGLVAAVLGSGDVIITAVPHPAALGLAPPPPAAAAADAAAGAGADAPGTGTGTGTVADGAVSANAGGANGAAPMEGVEGEAAGPSTAADPPSAAGDAAAAAAAAAPAADGDGGGDGGGTGAYGGPGDASELCSPCKGPAPAVSGMPPPAPAPLVRLLRPSVLLRARQALGGALPSCCDWHSPDPRRGPPQVLVGCWDGSAALWRLPRAAAAGAGAGLGLERPQSPLQLLFHIRADVMPLRRVASAPVWDTDFPRPAAAAGAAAAGAGAAAAAAAGVAAAAEGDGEGGGGGKGRKRARGDKDKAGGEGKGKDADKGDKGKWQGTAGGSGDAPKPAEPEPGDQGAAPPPLSLEARAAAAGCGVTGRAGSAGGPGPHMFVTLGYAGRFRLWDDRDVTRPALDLLVHRSYAHDGAWLRRPCGMAVVMDDGGLRTVLADTGAVLAGDDSGTSFFTFKEPSSQCLWSCAYSPELQLLLYGGADGVLGGAAWESPMDNRYRRPHVPIAGLVRDGPHLRLVGPSDLRGLQLLYPGGPYWRGVEAAGRVPRRDSVSDPRVTLFMVRAGYGAPADRARRSVCMVTRAGGGAEGERGQVRSAMVGGAQMRGGRGRGRMRAGSGAGRGEGRSREVGDDVEGVVGGGTVWVAMGWGAGLVRFMRLSVSTP